MTTPATKKVTTITPKKGFDFEALKANAQQNHWRKFRVEIRVREKLHAGKPKTLDAAGAMLKARGLEEVFEAREAEIPAEQRAETVVDEGLCEFSRREGKPGCWFPSNNLKAMLKENWSVLGYRMDARPADNPADKRKGEDVDMMEAADPKGEKASEKSKALKGSRAALAEGMFVVSDKADDLDWVFVGEKPDGVDQNVSHTIGPKGPQASIKRNEYFWRPTFVFEIWIAKAIASKIPDQSLVDTLLHAQEHGIGANRSQGMGKFDVVTMVEIKEE